MSALCIESLMIRRGFCWADKESQFSRGEFSPRYDIWPRRKSAPDSAVRIKIQ